MFDWLDFLIDDINHVKVGSGLFRKLKQVPKTIDRYSERQRGRSHSIITTGPLQIGDMVKPIGEIEFRRNRCLVVRKN